MYPTAPDLVGKDDVQLIAWEEPTIDRVGFEPRSEYVETFWLPIIGPSTLLLLRNIAHRFDYEPDGLTLNIDQTAKALGIGSRTGRNSAFHRSINRMVNFGMARTIDDDTLAVRRLVAPLHSGQVRRLSPSRRRLHERVLSERHQVSDEDQIRATKVASTLLRLGDSPDLVEQQLTVWGVQPGLAKSAVDHAWADKARDDQTYAATH